MWSFSKNSVHMSHKRVNTD